MEEVSPEDLPPLQLDMVAGALEGPPSSKGRAHKPSRNVAGRETVVAGRYVIVAGGRGGSEDGLELGVLNKKKKKKQKVVTHRFAPSAPANPSLKILPRKRTRNMLMRCSWKILAATREVEMTGMTLTHLSMRGWSLG